MVHEVYITELGRKEYILNPNGDPFVCDTDAKLLDLISTFYMDGYMEITKKNPEYRGKKIEIYIYPQFKAGDLVINRKTMQIRRVYRVGMHYITLCNIDDKYKAELQQNGYILSNFKEVSKENWIPLEEGEYNVYYPGSVLGKDENFDKMECDGMSTL